MVADHCWEILSAIAADMETSQAKEEQRSKSKRLIPTQGIDESAAKSHGARLHSAGLDLLQPFAEFRSHSCGGVRRRWDTAPADYRGRCGTWSFATWKSCVGRSRTQSLAASPERQLALQADGRHSSSNVRNGSRLCENARSRSFRGSSTLGSSSIAAYSAIYEVDFEPDRRIRLFSHSLGRQPTSGPLIEYAESGRRWDRVALPAGDLLRHFGGSQGR